jgi:hypothetical protein
VNNFAAEPEFFLLADLCHFRYLQKLFSRSRRVRSLTIQSLQRLSALRTARRGGLTLNDYSRGRCLFTERLFYIGVARSSLREQK